MNDDQLTRYHALEPRLPESFPRLGDHGVWYNPGTLYKWAKDNHRLNGLERLGLSILVMDAIDDDLGLSGNSKRIPYWSGEMDNALAALAAEVDRRRR